MSFTSKSVMPLTRRIFHVVANSVPQRNLAKRASSILSADMVGNFEIQSQSKMHAQLRRFTPDLCLPDPHLPNVYGGETLANCLLAACRILTPGKNHHPSSLTVEFLRPGSYLSPIEFSVTKMHESHRFMQASVFGKQNERAMALSSTSFHYEEPGPDSLAFDPSFPNNTPPPDEVPFIDSWASKNHISAESLQPQSHVRLFLGKMLGLQVKAVDPHAYLIVNKTSTVRCRFWVRANPEEIDANLPSFGEHWSSALLAYISDFCLLGPAMTQRPGFRVGKIVTLNHSMWFFSGRTMDRPSEWILIDLNLIHSGHNVCLCESHMWSEDGKRLLAVCKQQGLIRPISKKPKHEV